MCNLKRSESYNYGTIFFQLNHMAQGEQLSANSNSLSGSSAVSSSASVSVGTILAIAIGKLLVMQHLTEMIKLL